MTNPPSRPVLQIALRGGRPVADDDKRADPVHVQHVEREDEPLPAVAVGGRSGPPTRTPIALVPMGGQPRLRNTAWGDSKLGRLGGVLPMEKNIRVKFDCPKLFCLLFCPESLDFNLVG